MHRRFYCRGLASQIEVLDRGLVKALVVASVEELIEIERGRKGREAENRRQSSLGIKPFTSSDLLGNIEARVEQWVY